MLVDTEDLEKLAETCLETARNIKQYLASNGHPQPSFDQNGPEAFPPMPEQLLMAQLKLREASLRLHDLACPPDVPVTNYPYYVLMDLEAMRYINTFGIAKHVPLNADISYPELASKAGVDVTQLKQMVRQCCQIHVFTEKTGKVAHTAASKTLLSRSATAMSEYISIDVFNYAESQIKAIEKWGHGSQEPTESPYNAACNTDSPIYIHYEQNPVVRERFANVMLWASSMPPMSRSYIALGFDWTSLGAGKVVDVAGNMGQCSIEIAKANPKLEVIVQDLPGVIDLAKDPKTNIVPTDILPKFTFMAQDMFQPQPVTDADVYFYRMVFHNQSDKYGVKLLKALIPSMKPDAKLVVTDQVLPPVGAAPGPIERFMRSQDMQMMNLMNAQQRDMEQWTDLFAKADSRLKIKNVVSPPGSVMSFLEVVLDESTKAEPQG